MAASEDKIRNVGPKTGAWLRQVGVYSIADLKRLGAVETYLKVKRAGFRPSLNLLYALGGAIENCHWTELSDLQKNNLVAEMGAAESTNPIKTRWQKASDASDADSNRPNDQANDNEAPMDSSEEADSAVADDTSSNRFD